jgi:DNA-binding MarR family transcriptional regulator
MRQDNMKSLRKSLELLMLFLNNNSEISVTDIARLSGLNKSTAGRIASVLVEYNFLKQIEPRGNNLLEFRRVNKKEITPQKFGFAPLIKTQPTSS